MVYIYVGFGKTNQFGGADQIIPIPGNADPALDPVRHLDAVFSKCAIGDESSAFSYGPNQFVSYSSFTTRLKELLQLAGYDPGLYSGHSFRHGGASFLHSCGGTALMFQSCGGWSSQCFTRYLYMTESERLRAQTLICMGITNSL